MLSHLRNALLNFIRKPHVRPWALSAPIAVLVICLPLLRPLRHPAAMSDNEAYRLATVESIVERHTLSVSHSSLISAKENLKSYHRQPPVMAFLLAGPYWVLSHAGFTMQGNATLVAYLLTLLGVTLPVAAATGLVYRMGRLFELPRPWRAGLAMATALGSGWLSYATVLNAHAPAAALVLGAFACFFHLIVVKQPMRSGAWLMIAGFCAALAAVIDLSAMWFLVLLAPIILLMRWPWPLRMGGVLLYVLGALGPLLLHTVLIVPGSGSVLPRWALVGVPEQSSIITAPAGLDVVEEDAPASSVADSGSWLGRFFDGLAGAHGVFSHFPVLLMGVVGIGAVLHRHWPLPTKAMAVMTLVGAVGILLGYGIYGDRWCRPAFAARWFVLFLPVLFVWTGAWLRKSHRPAAWVTAGVLLGFSSIVSVIGATDPFVASPPGQYSAYSVVRQSLKRDTHWPTMSADARSAKRPE